MTEDLSTLMSRDAWRFGDSAAIPRFSWNTAASVDRQCALRDFIVVLAWDGATGKIDAYVVEVNRSISSYSSSGNLPRGLRIDTIERKAFLHIVQNADIYFDCIFVVR
jgi:hypothetical protein